MGRVYRARDVNLDRPVAVKVLRADSADDPDWLARFDREARLLATLHHPNIAAVYSFDAMDGLRYLAMELVPGQTLADHLAAGPMPLDEALGVCRQIAEGLEAAHDSGVIHRDLKPANVMLTPEGKVKLLDFGLAKNTAPCPESFDTVGPGDLQTAEGVIVGTPAYMAPEQARGSSLDRRCDIWAFGCILYEVLTGKRAFTGATLPDTLVSVLGSTPLWQELPAGVPPRLVELLRRCLRKDPQKRLRDAGDVRLELEEALADLAREPTPPARPVVRRRRWGLALLAAALVGLAAFALGRWGQATGPVVWSGQFLLGGAVRAYFPRVSPDGKWLAFIVLHDRQAQVGVMNLASGEWWVLTRNRERGLVSSLCWSRDSTRLFFDRYLDVPNGVFSASPFDRAPEGAREAPVVKEAEHPEPTADGGLLVSKLTSDGNSQLHLYSSDGTLRPVGPPAAFDLGWTAPFRTLHTRNEVVLCGKILDGKAPAERRFYLLNLDTNEYRMLWTGDVGADFAPLAVSRKDDFVYTVLPAEDAFHIVRFPLHGDRSPHPLMALTTQTWSLDVDAADRLYIDQTIRPLQVLRFDLPAEAGGPSRPGARAVERIAAPSLWRETEMVAPPLELPNGGVLLPSKAAGRDRLLAALPSGALVPLLENSSEQTNLPAALAGPNRLAFIAGSATNRRVRLAVLEDGHWRLDAVDLGVPGEGVTMLTAAPDGKTLYYVQSRQIYEAPTDGSQPPRKIERGDGIAVYPDGKQLLLERFEKSGVALFRQPRLGGRLEAVQVEPGALRLAPRVIESGAIRRDGRILVTVVSKDVSFWRPGLLSPDGKLQLLPLAFEGDVYAGSWSKDGTVLGVGCSLQSDLWRMAPQAPARRGFPYLP